MNILFYRHFYIRQVFRCVYLLLVLAIFVNSCSKQPQSVGRSRDVVVVSVRVDTGLIENNLQIYNYVPQKERQFTLFYVPETSMVSFDKFHTIFMYGSLADEFIDVLLSADAKKATERDTFTLFKLTDLWARNQFLIILAVSEQEFLQEGMSRYGSLVTSMLEENYYQRIKQSYYKKDMDERIRKKLYEYGYAIDVSEGWLIDSTFAKDNFVFVHAHFPDRSIFVYREHFKNKINTIQAVMKRNELTKLYYNGDYILNDLTFGEPIEFKNMHGVRLRGVWQNDSLVAGGPFISYFLSNGDTLYVLDAMLFNPGERKTDFLTTLEVMLNSFLLVNSSND